MTVDAKAAVAALLSAKDIEALKAAVDAAAFLDDVPGDDRQKLRAARSKLKKMVADQAAKNGSDSSSKTPVERSPHAKESYETKEFEALAAKYEKLNWRIISKPGGATVKPDDFYLLYGYHQQATSGDNATERPMWAEKGGLDFEGRARWDAWTNFKGVATEKAKLEFVRTYYEFPAKALYTDTRP